MRRLFKKYNPVAMATAFLILAGCGGVVLAETPAQKAQKEIDNRANNHKPYVPPWPTVELQHYEKAQKLFADPATILWCTTTWGNPSAPMVTIPIAGKLTSSSVSFFPSSRDWKPGDTGGGEYSPERRSVDSMYHGTPPPYRFGFTPGGQYTDLFNMPTLCTTALTKFQRQKTIISVEFDQAGKNADAQAEAALRKGYNKKTGEFSASAKAAAQRTLESFDTTGR